jgi:S-DNA-T family DNA segregation ATPase FtsK/SpoIIIE
MAKKRSTKKKRNNKLSEIAELFKKDRPRFILGVCIVFIGLYILLGGISFFFTGDIDQSKVLNKSFFDLISQKQSINNWTGVVGAFTAQKLINDWFGIFSLVIPIYFVILGLKLIKAIDVSLLKAFIVSAFILIWGSLTSSFILSRIFSDSYIIWGGAHGHVIEQILENSIGIPGVILVVLLLTIIFIVIVKKTSVEFFRSIFGKPFKKKTTIEEEDFNPYIYNVPEQEEEDDDEPKNNKPTLFSRLKSIFIKNKKDIGNIIKEDESGDSTYKKDTQKNIVKQEPLSVDDDFQIIIPEEEEYIPVNPVKRQPVLKKTEDEDSEDDTEIDNLEEMEDYDPTKDLSSFAFPSADLLKVYDTTGKVNMEEQNANKSKIITTLQNYGIEITSITATVGPTITLYEIVPKAGVRISKIRNLEDDIALSLSALGIRIIAPMPGKGTIGIEVPNKEPQIVSMQSVIASKRFQECTYDLPVALGKTITNEVFMFDLCKMPHLLVAGATGQGKSVGLNAIITSLLYKKHPAEMKMVLVDPKMVEFNIYSRIEKHYLAKLPDAEKAIITDVTKVTQTLNSLTKEMDDRYELLMNAGVRNIKEYNEKFRKRRLLPTKGHRFLPYLVIIIDEFGDLIMTAGKEIEMPIARIAQKARAVGMHMVIATQRPTTNIITGTIKANFPARMAFRVTSQIDSRTILDMSGANQLIGRGDMLFSQGSDLIRIQCAFVDTPEVEGIAQYIGSQQGYSHAFELPEYVGEGSEEKIGNIDLNDRDPLFEEAARLIVVHQQGSTSLIQRKFSIGYNRAGRLMDQLEAAGIVGPTQGSKPREVYIADEYHLEQLLSQLG